MDIILEVGAEREPTEQWKMLPEECRILTPEEEKQRKGKIEMADKGEGADQEVTIEMEEGAIAKQEEMNHNHPEMMEIEVKT